MGVPIAPSGTGPGIGAPYAERMAWPSGRSRTPLLVILLVKKLVNSLAGLRCDERVHVTSAQRS